MMVVAYVQKCFSEEQRNLLDFFLWLQNRKNYTELTKLRRRKPKFPYVHYIPNQSSYRLPWMSRTFQTGTLGNSQVDYHLSQALSEHGSFGFYLYRIGKKQSPDCQYCYMEHTIFVCRKCGNKKTIMDSKEYVKTTLSFLPFLGLNTFCGEKTFSIFPVFPVSEFGKLETSGMYGCRILFSIENLNTLCL